MVRRRGAARIRKRERERERETDRQGETRNRDEEKYDQGKYLFQKLTWQPVAMLTK